MTIVFRHKYILVTPTVIAFLLVATTVLIAEPKSSDPCNPSVLPKEIQTTLDKNYPDWQPEKLENLYEDDRGFWLKANPDDCPGIAIGHFESKTDLSYAVLLISKPGRKRLGLRILVFSRPTPSSSYAARLMVKWDIGAFFEGSDQVIFTVAPGHYEEAIGTRKVATELDSIFYETMEKGAILYYWKNGRYHELITSD